MKRPVKKWLVFCTGLLVLGSCAAGLYTMKPLKKKLPPQTERPPRRVTVERIHPTTTRMKIIAYGEVAPRWTSVLRARVQGRIVRISDSLAPGSRLSKGDIVLELDRTDYLVGQAEARLALETARENLIRTEHEAAQAKADWQRSGIKEAPASPLVFHAPQIRIARARVALAQSNMDKAENDLARTRILAPYDCLVAKRFANRGEILFSGDKVVTVLSMDDLEIGVALNEAQVKALGPWETAAVTLKDPSTGKAWSGKVIRDGRIVDQTTRLRRFYLIPTGKTEGLLPGMFVTAVIQGSRSERLFALPESALTRDGRIWQVSPARTLESTAVTPVFYENGRVFVRGGEGPLDVVVMPSPAFLQGARVTVQGEK